MPTITLLTVPTVDAEAAVLADLDRLTRQVGTVVAPVLDRGDLPGRVERVLVTAGCEVQVCPFDRPVVPGSGPAGREPDRPDAVLSGPGVAPDVVALAAGLCRVTPFDLDRYGADPAAGAPSAALVLLDPEQAALDAVVPPLVAMAADGVRLGVLYTLDPVEARFAVLKSLLVGTLRSRGKASVLYADPDPRAEGGPPILQYASSPEGRERFTRRQDLLLVNGHANPLDAALGDGAAVCARAGSSAPGAGRAFPCFHDGRCFRQPLMGRDADDHAGLLPIGATGADIVVLSGCNVATLGRAWFDARHGLAYQAQQRAGLACAVTASVALGRLEFDLLLMALVADGLPLGDVVAEVNRVRTDVHGHANAYPPGVGPFLLLGNPCLRVEGPPPQPVVAVRSGRGLSVELSGVRFDPERGAVLRVDLDPADRPPFLFLTGTPDDAWCRGIWYPGDAGTVLYLWLGAGDGPAAAAGRVEIEVSDEDPSAALVTGVEHCLRQVPFWTIALGAYRSRSGDSPWPSGSVDAALAALPGVVGDVSRALTALTPTRGMLVDAGATRALARGLWQTTSALAKALLDALVDSACRFGTLPLVGWEEHLRRLDRVGPLPSCTCGSPVWGQRYGYPDGGTLVRSNYQCPLCGPIGEDDGRRLLRLDRLSRSVEQGGPVTAELTVSAPDDELVQVHAAVVIESLFRDTRMVGEAAGLVVAPGEERGLTLVVPVPGDLTPGAYPVAVVAVVNGAACLIRQIVEVVATPAPVDVAPRRRSEQAGSASPT